MLRTSPAPKPHAKTLDEQKTDFTAEGSPPPGKVGTDVPVTDAQQADSTQPRGKRGTVTRKGATQPADVVTPETAIVTSSEAGAIPSVPMQQAHRDIKKGLKDTDRAAELGRTYQKLKR